MKHNPSQRTLKIAEQNVYHSCLEIVFILTSICTKCLEGTPISKALL